MRKRKDNPALAPIEALSEISRAITSDLYLEDILRLIVTVTAQVLNSKICSLMLLDEKNNELVLRATQSMSEVYNKKPNIKIGKGVSGKVAATGRPMTVMDVGENPLYISGDIAKKERLKSLLCVPLTVKGKVIGVLNNYTSRPHKFTSAEIKILTTVAGQAAIVIENARLLVESKVIQEELESRKTIERAKGILMKQQSLTEDEAFKKIRKKSMDSRKSMRQIAEAIILAKEMEG